MVLKWVNYKNVLHRKMCNLGHILPHVEEQHTGVTPKMCHMPDSPEHDDWNPENTKKCSTTPFM